MPKKARSTRTAPETPSMPDVVRKIRFSLETYKDLSVEALGRGISMSAMIEELFRSVPRRYILSERTAKPPAEMAPRPVEAEPVKGPKLVVGPPIAESA